MRRLLLLICLTAVLLAGLATTAQAERDLWVTMQDQVDIWDNAGNRIDTVAIPMAIAGAGQVYGRGIAQSPHNGEILVAARYWNADWSAGVGSALLRFNQSTHAYLGKIMDLPDHASGISFGDDGDLYATWGENALYKYDGVTYADKGVSGALLASDIANQSVSVAVKGGVAYVGRWGVLKTMQYFSTTTGTQLGELSDGPNDIYAGPGVIIGPDGLLYNAGDKRIFQWDISSMPGSPPTTATLFVNGRPTGPDGQVLNGNSQLGWNTEDNWITNTSTADATPTVKAFADLDSGTPWRYLATSALQLDGKAAMDYHYWVDPNAGSPAPKNRGDVTEDLFVGADDLVRILTHWGESGAGVTWSDGDCAPYGDGITTGDQFVGADDYVEVLSMWGTSYPAEPTPTPEPATLGLMLLGGLAGLIRRR